MSEVLRAYYLFIGVVDEALDVGNLDLGSRILQSFILKEPHNSRNTLFAASIPGLMTNVLRQHTTDNDHPLISANLAELYREVVSERMAPSIGAYIHHRKMVGIRTAELSYLLIRGLLQGDTYRVSQLMMHVGKVGCLIDSLIDLKMDSRARLLNFRPSVIDRLQIAVCALWEGGQTIFRYPALTMVFAEVVADNIRDRFRQSNGGLGLTTAACSDEVTSVV